MALSPEQKAAIRTRLEAGGSVRSLAKEYGTTEKTVRRIKNATPIPQGTQTGDVSPPSPPPVSFGDEPAPPSPRVSLSGQACGEMAGLGFTIFSFFNGQGWQLEPGEKAEIGQALADCVPMLPTEAAEKLVQASAPLNALAILAKIVMRRLAKIAQVAAVEAAKRQQDMVAQHVTIVPPPPSPANVPPPPPTAPVEVAGGEGQPPVTVGVVTQRATNGGVFARA